MVSSSMSYTRLAGSFSFRVRDTPFYSNGRCFLLLPLLLLLRAAVTSCSLSPAHRLFQDKNPSRLLFFSFLLYTHSGLVELTSDGSFFSHPLSLSVFSCVALCFSSTGSSRVHILWPCSYFRLRSWITSFSHGTRVIHHGMFYIAFPLTSLSLPSWLIDFAPGCNWYPIPQPIALSGSPTGQW